MPLTAVVRSLTLVRHGGGDFPLVPRAERVYSARRASALFRRTSLKSAVDDSMQSVDEEISDGTG